MEAQIKSKRTPAHILAELLGVSYAEKRELLEEFVVALASCAPSEFWRDVQAAKEKVAEFPRKKGGLGEPSVHRVERVTGADLRVGDLYRYVARDDLSRYEAALDNEKGGD